MSTIYPEIKSILDKCGVSADHVASIIIEPMTVTFKRYATVNNQPYSDGKNNVVMMPDLVIHIETRDNREPTEQDWQQILKNLREYFKQRSAL